MKRETSKAFPDPVGEAADVLAVLQKRHAAAIGRREELTTARERIAFLAVGQENAAAQRQVAEINAELITLGETVATIEAAIAEAERRVRLAEEREQLGQDRAAASEALDYFCRLEQAADLLDRCFAATCQAYDDFERLHGAMLATGAVNHPSLTNLRAHARRAYLTGLSPVAAALRTERPLPAEQISFSGAIGRFAPGVRAAIGRKLNPTAKENVA